MGPSELLPRYIFAESLFARRRVLEVDAVASTGGESARFLVERGARAVVSCDADVTAVDAAHHGARTGWRGIDTRRTMVGHSVPHRTAHPATRRRTSRTRRRILG